MHILSLALFAQKAGEGNEVTWVEFSPQSHFHLVKQALALAPPSYPLALVKRVMFSFLLEVINSLDLSLGQFTKASAPCHYCHAPIPAPSSLPAPPTGLVQALRPSALDPVLAAQPSSLMAMDSPLPPPSDLSPLSPTPMPHALDFVVTVTRPTPMMPSPPMPQPGPPSSPSLSATSSGTSAKRLKASAHKSTGGGRSKHPLGPLSPSYNSPLKAQAILVLFSEPGQ